MRRLTYLILFLAGAYATYWFVGANRVTAGFESALTQMQAEGWTARADVATRGFPSRFDTTLSDVSIGGPAADWGYSAAFVQTLALSYRPNNVILVLPETQRITSPADLGTLNAQRLRASATVKPNLALAFDDLTAEGEALTYTSDAGWNMTLDQLLVAARLQQDRSSTYDVYAKLDQFTLPGAAGLITETIVDADVRLQAPLDRTTQEVRIEQIVVSALRMVWSGVVLSGEGQLDVDANGTPEGQVLLRVENWQALIPRLVEIGAFDPDVGRTAQTMGVILAQGSDTLTLPLKYENGFGFLGPLPLGPAPKLHFLPVEQAGQ